MGDVSGNTHIDCR